MILLFFLFELTQSSLCSKYGQYLKDNFPDSSLLLHGADGGFVSKSSSELYTALIDSINAVYEEIIHGSGITNDSIYQNPLSVVDGPCYAFVVHGKGPAVLGFGETFSADASTTSRYVHKITSLIHLVSHKSSLIVTFLFRQIKSNVIIEKNVIKDLKCWTKEIPATIIDGKVQNDARGAIFQLVDTFSRNGIAMDSDGKYVSNPVADMQLFVAQEILEGNLHNDYVLNTGINSISNTLLEWARDGTVLDPSFRCSGDSMHHVGKGIAVIRVEETINFFVRNNVRTLSMRLWGQIA